MSHDIATHTTGIVAVGASAAPTPIYGYYLTTHGIWLLSWAEWIQVIGSIYVACLLLKWMGVFKGARKLYSLMKGKLKIRRELRWDGVERRKKKR